jgi:hypothetical protein
MKEDNKDSPFLAGSNKATLWSLISRMLVNFEQRWGTGEAETFLNENDDRGKGNRQKGMKNTHLVSFILDPRKKDLADPIPEGNLDDIRDYTF